MIKFILVLLELFLTFWTVSFAFYIDMEELSHEENMGARFAITIMFVVWNILLFIIIKWL